MNLIFSLPRWRMPCWSAVFLALPFWFASAPAGAQWYSDRPADTHGSETAAQIDPFDPVPEIGRDDCRGGDCRRPGAPRGERERHGPELPLIGGHPTLMVDCSGQHRDMFPSLEAAVRRAPPNATILILSPKEGMTCQGGVEIGVPLTIATYGGGDSAVIQAPPGFPCLIADIPLGDTLTIEGVRFVARGGVAPCVIVQAGHVVVRHSSIDSRTTNWAFDVVESGELTVEATHVETDRSGVRAWRAQVDLHGLDIDIDARRVGAQLGLRGADCTTEDDPALNANRVAAPQGADDWDKRDTVQGSVGLALQCTDGVVDAGEINGGAIGILASAGTHGLALKDAHVRRAQTGMLLLRGQVGGIDVERAILSKNTNGIIVAPGAESQITGAAVTDSADTGIAVYGTDTLISGNKVVGAETGIQLFADGAFPPPYLAIPPPRLNGFSADPPLDNDDGAKPIVENNLVANTRLAAVRIDGRVGDRVVRMHGSVIGNTFYARHGECIDDKYDDDPVRTRANTCNKSWFSWPF